MSDNIRINFKVAKPRVKMSMQPREFDDHGYTVTEHLPVVGDVVVLSDGVKRMVIGREWAVPDLIREVSVFLDAAEARRHSM